MSPKKPRSKRLRMRRVEVYGNRGHWEVKGLGVIEIYGPSYTKARVLREARRRCRADATPEDPIALYTRIGNGRWHLLATYGAEPRRG